MSIETRPHITREAFAEQLHSTFALAAGEAGTVPAELIELLDGPEGRGYEQFSLVFRTAADIAEVQGTYDLDHPALGRTLLFLVPVGRNAEGLHLQAVITRRIAPPEG